MRTRVLTQRVVAYFADSFFVFLLWTPVFRHFNSMRQSAVEEVSRQGGVPPEDLALAGWLTILLTSWLLWPLVSIPYYALQEGFFGGRTLGKRLTGIRVVRIGGGAPVGIWRATLRSVMRFVDGLPLLYLLGWFVAVCSEDRRRLGDLLAGTAVVDVYGRVAPSHPEPGPLTVPAHQPMAEEDAEALRRRKAAGEEGERVVRGRLFSLIGSGCHLFSGIYDRSFGDVDNLVVAPTGVWVIEAKSHRGEVSRDPHTGGLLRNGEPFEKDFHRQVERQVEHVRKALSGCGGPRTVRWLICFSRARLAADSDGMWPLGACGPEDLVEVVSAAPLVYRSEEVARIARDVERAYGVRPWAAPKSVSSRED